MMQTFLCRHLILSLILYESRVTEVTSHTCLITHHTGTISGTGSVKTTDLCSYSSDRNAKRCNSRHDKQGSLAIRCDANYRHVFRYIWSTLTNLDCKIVNTETHIFYYLNNQPDALIIQIYSVIKLYMFRASPLPIIRSSLLYIRHW